MSCIYLDVSLTTITACVTNPTMLAHLLRSQKVVIHTVDADPVEGNKTSSRRKKQVKRLKRPTGTQHKEEGGEGAMRRASTGGVTAGVPMDFTADSDSNSDHKSSDGVKTPVVSKGI